MGISFGKDPSGLFTIHLAGIFTEQDRKGLEDFGRSALEPGKKAKVLILDEGFTGWARKGNWGDMTFMLEYDPSIEKIAVVADEKWRDDMLIYLGAGLRDAMVKFFPQGQEAMARTWLG
jgi:hypothetical protein